MKKFTKLLLLSAAVCALTGTVCHAANGDSAGHVYSTDIRAFINGVEVPSYNIGGKTAVVVEDITNEHIYSDRYRLLKIGGRQGCFKPDTLISGSGESSAPVGSVTGDIYETDIKTLIYDTEIPSYNIGGKTAVAIEDLGGDKKFSDIGGKYVWNESDRTISLEFIYSRPLDEVKSKRGVSGDMTINDDWTRAEVTFRSTPLQPGGLDLHYPEHERGSSAPSVMPVMTVADGQDKLMGYYFIHADKDFSDNGDNTGSESKEVKLFYFYEDVMTEAIETADIPPMRRADIVQWYLDHSVNKVNDRFDTDDYTFLYAGFYGTPHGGAAILLLRVDDNGNYHNYITDLHKRNYGKGAQLQDVTIDKENEKVHIKYDKDYTIDLKTGNFSADDEEEFVSAYPARPETDREHYVIYKEGFRDDRTELALFDGTNVLVWDKNNEGSKSLGAAEGDAAYKNDIKYYLDGDKWVEFESGYNCVSNNASAVLETDVKLSRKYTPSYSESEITIPAKPSSNAGTVAGDMYYTDIKAYVFDAPVTSYNIGGRTVIDTEILGGYYGFDVNWHDSARWLEVQDAMTSASNLAADGKAIESADGKTGEKAGVYYNTDIVTTLNGKEIESYNIGGRTFLVAENMRDFGYIVDWNEQSRELRVSRYPSDEQSADKLITDYGELPVTNLTARDDNYLRTYGDYTFFADKHYYLPLRYGRVYDSMGSIEYVRLSEIEDALNAECKLETKKADSGYEYTLVMNYDKSDIPYLSDKQSEESNLYRIGGDITTGFVKFVSQYRLPAEISVNGGVPNMFKVAGLNDLKFHFLVLNGEIWIPANPLNSMFGFDAFLE